MTQSGHARTRNGAELNSQKPYIADRIVLGATLTGDSSAYITFAEICGKFLWRLMESGQAGIDARARIGGVALTRVLKMKSGQPAKGGRQLIADRVRTEGPTPHRTQR